MGGQTGSELLPWVVKQARMGGASHYHLHNLLMPPGSAGDVAVAFDT